MTNSTSPEGVSNNLELVRTHIKNTKILNGLSFILSSWLNKQTFTFNNSALFFKAYTDLSFFEGGIGIAIFPEVRDFMYFVPSETYSNINVVVHIPFRRHDLHAYARNYLFQNRHPFKDTFYECFTALLYDYLEGNELTILHLDISLFTLYTELSLFCLKHEIDTVYFPILVSQPN